jgi:hypothetical protein
MPAERVPMRQVREVLRLTYSTAIPGREIARALRGCAFYSASNRGALSRGGAHLANSRRHDGRAAGGEALRQYREQTRTPPLHRARLGRGSIASSSAST